MSLSKQSYKGTRDLYPSDMRVRNYIFDTWRRVAKGYGYVEYAAPLVEPTEIYAAKSGEEIVGAQTYAFTDRGEREVAIRPEMTPSIARMIAAKRQEFPMPARLFSIANFMRYERPQKGREREFWQLNVDLFGATGIQADAEMICLASDILRAFKATDDMFTIRVNDRRLTDFVMREYLSLTSDDAGRMVKLLDRRDKMPRDDFRASAAEILIGDAEKLAKLDRLVEANTLDELPTEIADSSELSATRDLIHTLRERGVKNVVFDITLMRGFDYYTGMVFEVFDEAPENRRAMFGGGRYDGLVGLFGVDDLGVVGMAPGETMTIEFLRAHNLLPAMSSETDVTLISLTENDEKVSALAHELRSLGVNVAVDFTHRKADKMIRAAVKTDVPFALFVGDNELAENKFTLKDLSNEKEEKVGLEEIATKIRMFRSR